MRKHLINLETAITMTSAYRDHKEGILAPEYKGQNILPLSETFDRQAFDTLLTEANCKALRIYYGMDEYLKVHAIIVAVDQNNSDILPTGNPIEIVESFAVVEEGQRCPDICPPISVLNHP